MIFTLNLCKYNGAQGGIYMIMDIAILVVLVLTIFFSMRKGFAMSVVSFFKGFASLIAAWFFCDDLADYAINNTEIGQRTINAINQNISAKWESSDVYMALPDLFKGNGSEDFTSPLIQNGSARVAYILLTIICFVLIVVVLRGGLALIGKLFSHQNNEGFSGTIDWILGLILGIIVGILYVFLFLALLVPVISLFVPQHCETVMRWLDNSFIAGDLYDNNLLLIFFRDLLN